MVIYMNYIFGINKPKEYTSRDVVNIVSKKLNIKKVGHAGTLDPLATGVLIICSGFYTKLIDLITNNNKEYIAEVLLGINTDTLDITGEVLDRKEVNVNIEDVKKALNSFKGKIIQEVPKYSAVKVKGKKLYEYARSNVDIELPKREVEIFDIELISDIYDNKFKIKCNVSKGTYIRSLIRDIGLKLNTYAVMNNLERTKQGDITLEECITINDLDNIKNIDIDKLIKLEKIFVNSEVESKIKNGVIINKFFKTDKAIIYNKNNKLLAIYETYDKDNNMAKPIKVINNS